jgi:Protein of unknown function (DUF3093)
MRFRPYCRLASRLPATLAPVTSGADSPDGTTYAESMPVPVLVSLVAVGIAGTFGIAVGAALGWLAGVFTTVVVVVAVVILLRRATGRVTVIGGELRAGRATLPPWARGRVVALDAEGARKLRGVDADPQAFLYLRGWVPTAVRVEVVDPHDPAPYWYVSTRRPADLVTALRAAKPPKRLEPPNA